MASIIGNIDIYQADDFCSTDDVLVSRKYRNPNYKINYEHENLNSLYYRVGLGVHLYHISFPLHMAIKHPEIETIDSNMNPTTVYTGPENCANCEAYGFWCNMFIGYCGNCMELMYENNIIQRSHFDMDRVLTNLCVSNLETFEMHEIYNWTFPYKKEYMKNEPIIREREREREREKEKEKVSLEPAIYDEHYDWINAPHWTDDCGDNWE